MPANCIHNKFDKVSFLVPNLCHVSSETFDLYQKFCHMVRSPIKNIAVIDSSPNIAKFSSLLGCHQLVSRNPQIACCHASVWPMNNSGRSDGTANLKVVGISLSSEYFVVKNWAFLAGELPEFCQSTWMDHQTFPSS